MKNRIISKIKNIFKNTHFGFFLVLILLSVIVLFIAPEFFGNTFSSSSSDVDLHKNGEETVKSEENVTTPAILPLDTVAYDKKLNELANNPPDPIVYKTVKTVIGKDKKGKEIIKTEKIPLDPQPVRTHLWPVKSVYPNAGAILPFSRIIAFYGNLYSKGMGILGQYGEEEVVNKLNTEVKKWSDADPTTPTIPALHYIAVVAQGAAGQDGKYRARMPFTEIDKIIKMATKAKAIVFLDVQVGFSTLQTELPLLEKYLKMPQVHLGIDPEFSMKNGIRPGKIVGTFDASDINYAAGYLAKLVKDNNLTPKILIVHRYTGKMVTNSKDIKPLPEVQIVMDMDGWGDRDKKLTTYHDFIYKEPVQFTGFKLFYKNDTLTPGTSIMTPAQVLKLTPRPSYIQYQ